MRLLHPRHDHARAGAPRAQRQSDATTRSAAHMQPNLCRCGTHMRILRAVRRGAIALQAREKTRHDRRACTVSRRDFLAGGRRAGRELLAVARRAAHRTRRKRTAALPGSLKKAPVLDSWIRIGARRHDHRLHRQGRARPGHQDRAAPARRGGARRRSSPHRAGHRGHGAHAERGLHRGQPLDEGQRHGDHERRRPGARRSCSSSQRRGSASRQTRSPWRTAPCAPATGAASTTRARCRAVAARGGAAAVTPGRREAPQRHRQAAAARRHSGQGHRRRRVRAGSAPARDGARARGAPAELRRAAARRSIQPPSRRCRACSRSCATAASSQSSPNANIRRFARCARSDRGASWDENGARCRRPTCTRNCTSLAARRLRDPRRARRPAALDARSDLPAALPDARLDRPVVRRRAVRRTAR